jgi:hypothetical protein|tara:strand:+ start:291 stop:482 length:192 start_codon:yes stop_codon:yes gene_type:complete
MKAKKPFKRRAFDRQKKIDFGGNRARDFLGHDETALGKGFFVIATARSAPFDLKLHGKRRHVM